MPGPAWLLLLAGLVALIAPALVTVANASWSTDQGAFGPIVLAVAIWLFAREAGAVRAAAQPGNAAIAAAALAPLLVLVVLARWTNAAVIETTAAYLALVAVAYLFVGWPGLARVRFPLAYMLLALPVAGTILGPLVQPLRPIIAAGAIRLLDLVGYPIAHEGSMIYIGPYRLFVEAACAGYNSMISLTAIGLFHAWLMHDAKLKWVATLLPTSIALALTANFVRVVAIVLVTWHLGDEAGQGFLHGFAGLLMFAVALAGFFAVDAAYTRIAAWRRG